MTRLILQIPCYNEEATLALTIAGLPKQIPGIDRIETLVIDDGSEDDTLAIAKKCGVDHVVSLSPHQGLARAFSAGLAHALSADVDIIVTMDADNQYLASDIERLMNPLLKGEADMVIGVRDIQSVTEFSRAKKLLHRLGSVCVSIASGMRIADPVSGFRAFSRATAEKLRVYNRYTYTVETVIQAGRQRMRVRTIPIARNTSLRASRLVSSIPLYVVKQGWILCKTWIRYAPWSFARMLAVMLLCLVVLTTPLWLL